MRKEILQEAAGYSVVHKRHRIWNKIVSVLACIVVFCTTYALILPAMTLEKSPQCEKIEHIHTDACYTQLLSQSKKVLACTPESLELHQHTEACRNENGELCCGDSDFVVHQHDAACYDENGALWCTLPEIVAHTHDESCYAPPETGQEETIEPTPQETTEPTQQEAPEPTQQETTEPAQQETAEPIQQETAEPTQQEAPELVLICGREEVILHQHTEACFETDESGNAHLVCGQTQVLEHVHSSACLQTVEEPLDTEILNCTVAEGEGAHTHTEAGGCYDSSGELICQLPESTGHQHGPLCYGTWELSCNQEEHTHTELCMPTETNPPLDLLATPEPPQQVLADGDTLVTVTPHKTIDAFRDGVDNPDTDLDNSGANQTDLHRLYLDAVLSKETNPVDLLIVIDQSGSMHMNYTWGGTGWVTVPDDQVNDAYRDMLDGSKKIFRDEAVRLVLNGTYDSADFASKKEKGLIYQFLALNEQNNVAVVEFHGEEHTNEALSPYTYNTDASTLVNWMDQAYYNDPANDSLTYVNTKGQIANATNYCAGLSQAYNVLNDERIKNNGHKKVLLFMSDGVPTVYLEKYEDGSYQKGGTGSSVVGNTTNPNPNLQMYRDKSMDFFNMLISKTDPNAHPDLVAYTVGISKDATDESSTTGIHSPWVMNEMAKASGGEFIGANTTDALWGALRSIIHKTYYSNLVIQDELSDWVNLYAEQPDYKVTMKNSSNEVIVLFDRGVITEAGKGKLSSVSYDENTRTVSAVFEPNYKMEEDCTYTLSFNVQTDSKAYEDHAKNNYPNTGDPNTDYGTNTTSSNKPGYRSNKEAFLTYKKPGIDTPVKETYQHPVVQVTDRELVVKKQWLAYDGTDITRTQGGSIGFVLHQLANPVDPTVPTATVTVTSQRGSAFVKPTQVEIDSQVTLTFQKSSGWLSRITSFQVNGRDMQASLTQSGSTYTYTFTVSQNTEISIGYLGSSPNNFNLSVVPPPEAKWPIDKIYEAGTLSADGKWQAVFKNLPLSGTIADTNGKMTDVLYTYYVEELSTEGYKTTYDNNDGIVQGTVTITNQSTTPSTHVLPNTGGTGTEPYTLGGLLLISMAVLLLYSKKKHGKGDAKSS